MIAYRDATPDDDAFVTSTWSRGFKHSPTAGMIASEDWPTVMHAQIPKLRARSDVRTIVGHDAADPDFLYGFIAGDASGSVPVVFFVYVKEAFRRAGFARGLFAELGIVPSRPFVYTCWTQYCRRLAAKIPYAQHDPDFARYPKQEPKERPTWRP